MCVINFNFNYEDLDTGLIFDHEGEYRLQDSASWIPFLFDLENPQTPFLTEIGNYQMRIRIFDGRAWSDWFYSYFQIGCGAFDIGYSRGFEA